MSLENFRVCDGDLDEELLNRYGQGSVLAVDTETMGLLPAPRSPLFGAIV